MVKTNCGTTTTNYVRVDCKVCNWSWVITVCENINWLLKTCPDKCRACNWTWTDTTWWYQVTYNVPTFTC